MVAGRAAPGKGRRADEAGAACAAGAVLRRRARRSPPGRAPRAAAVVASNSGLLPLSPPAGRGRLGEAERVRGRGRTHPLGMACRIPPGCPGRRRSSASNSGLAFGERAPFRSGSFSEPARPATSGGAGRRGPALYFVWTPALPASRAATLGRRPPHLSAKDRASDAGPGRAGAGQAPGRSDAPVLSRSASSLRRQPRRSAGRADQTAVAPQERRGRRIGLRPPGTGGRVPPGRRRRSRPRQRNASRERPPAERDAAT